MSKFAIVILYEGSKPSGRTMAAIHAALCESGIVSDVEKVEMYDLSEKEIVGAIAAAPKNAEHKAADISPEAEAVLLPSIAIVLNLTTSGCGGVLAPFSPHKRQTDPSQTYGAILCHEAVVSVPRLQKIYGAAN